MISQTETAGANQYGFYAVPKAMEPRKKYRDEDEYEDEEEQENQNAFETIEDKEPINEKQLQRDYYVDQAPYPEFKPRERGLDFGVQIERGDLFDFDLEVKSLIQILVGRSVVSAINELQEEKEKDERKNNLQKYQKKRNAELMVTQRLQAKHKRKIEQAERRKLQKDLFVKNQKQLGKKLISRRNAKESLLGLKKELLSDLQELGYLRCEPTSDLKIKYEQWLYAQIMEALKFEANAKEAATRMLEQHQKALANDHKKFIEQQMGRRQSILDERQRIRKETEERKEKKRIRKMRKRLNSQREPDFIRFEELLQRSEQVASIMKFGDRSNGFTNDFASRSSLYVAGGIDCFILALLQSSDKDLSSEQIEAVLLKLIAESGKQLDFSLLADHFDKVQQVKKRMEEQKLDFMRDKQNQVQQLSEEISLDLSLLEISNFTVKSKLLNNFIRAVLSIYLTTKPESTQENPYQLSDNDKKRLQASEKIKINRQEQTFIKRLQKIQKILRVHFELQGSENPSHKSKSEPVQEEVSNENEWIDIYDGQGWTKRKGEKKQIDRTTQQASAITLTGLQNSFVIDERVLHFLQLELEKLLDISGGEKFHRFSESLSNLGAKISNNTAVLDAQLHIG